ncbi:hypothetical protein Pla52o_51000 [Novipirellula galeiformis]|uniref:Uncharacterized protein n=1 Tax=Novipirellula galeiformis TaxID=2528004 RepID=A0A5C6C2R4_9BACT|nr:hypothetical protein Pla52o_51000 [Novipirellula galeiformis]
MTFMVESFFAESWFCVGVKEDSGFVFECSRRHGWCVFLLVGEAALLNRVAPIRDRSPFSFRLCALLPLCSPNKLAEDRCP